jgi:hypothetical protein
VGHQLAGRREALDVQGEGGAHRGGDSADAGNGGEVVFLWQASVGSNQQLIQAFLPRARVAELADVVADQLLGGRAPKRGDRVAGVLQEGAGLDVGEVRDTQEVYLTCLGEARGGGVAMDQFEDPAGGAILGLQGPFRERQRQ